MLKAVKDYVIEFPELESLLNKDYKIKYIVDAKKRDNLDNLDYDLDILILGTIREHQYISNLPPCLKYIIVYDSDYFNPHRYNSLSNNVFVSKFVYDSSIEYPNNKHIKMPHDCIMKYYDGRYDYDNDQYFTNTKFNQLCLKYSTKNELTEDDY